MEFTQICKEILGIGKKLEKIEPDELRKIKTDIERISELVAANKTLFDTDKKDFDGKYNKIVEIIKTFDTLKAQIEEVLKSGTINDSAEALISTFSSKKIMALLNEAKGVVDEKFSTIHKNGITPWNSTLEYPAGAISVLNGKLYQAKTQNTNKKPSENKEIWRVIASEEWCEQTFLNKNEKIDAYTKQESDDKFVPKTELTDGLPIGAYLSYSSQKTIPAGFLIADGRSLKKSEYPELFNVLGYIYGGSGENFNLPNFADGKFMRSIGGNAAGLGVVQQDEIKSHSHGIGQQPGVGQSNNGGTGGFVGQNSYIQSGATGGNETRPYNMAVVVIVKAKNVNTPAAGQIDKTIFATEVKPGITKLKNAITAKQEDAAVTEKAVSDFVEQHTPPSLGINQTWQEVTSQRRFGETYTNTTGKPIYIQVNINNAANVMFLVEINNIKIEHNEDYRCVMNYIIPPNATYKVYSQNGATNYVYTKWYELR